MAKTTRRLLDAAEAAAARHRGAALGSWEELRAFHRLVGETAVAPEGHAALVTAIESGFGELRALLERVAGERRLTARDADAAAVWGEVLASDVLARALPRFGV